MNKRIPALLVLVVIVAAMSAAVAGAKSVRTKHKLSATAQLGAISTAANFPAIGSATTDAGIVKSTVGGRGAETDALKVTATPAPGTLTLSGKAKLFYDKGTQTAKVTIQATIAADGSVAYTGSGTFTKGTGIYKGATGKVTFTGASPANSGVTTLNATGTITY
jgi:hypothetical protein